MHVQKDEAEIENNRILFGETSKSSNDSNIVFTVLFIKCWSNSFQANQTLNVTFSLDSWPRSCCQFDVQVKLSSLFCTVMLV